MMEKAKIRVLIGKPGLDGHDRGSKVVAQGLRDAGMEVIYLGLRLTPEQIADVAVQEDVDVIGLGCSSNAHNALFPRTAEVIRSKMDKEVIIIGGGIIPPKDVPGLKAAGIAEIFGPGTTIASIVAFIRSEMEKVSV